MAAVSLVSLAKLSRKQASKTISCTKNLLSKKKTTGSDSFPCGSIRWHLQNLRLKTAQTESMSEEKPSSHWFHGSFPETVPDIMTMAKALGNGAPISAFISTAEIADTYTKPGASTLGGNPVSSTAGLAVLDYIAEHQLMENARLRGNQLQAGLAELQKKYPVIGDIRGLGLMVGAEFVHPETKEPYPDLLDELLETLKNRGFIIGKNGVARNVMAFQPPLVITEEDIHNLLNALELALSEIQ